ncbi:ankyrin repeat domain-containing protein [Stenotrophomonas maltophilia]|nr:ankyrin repeat domain-containing protein [Stenotrophomonas maltophilia]
MDDVAALNAALAAAIFPDPRDRHGQTPLHFAAHLGNVEAVSALLLAGASPNARDRHAQTPLHLAARSDHVGSSGPAAAALAALAALADGRPWTSVHATRFLEAWERRDPAATCATLLAVGAEPNAPNCRHETPIGLAYPRAMKAFVPRANGSPLDPA